MRVDGIRFFCFPFVDAKPRVKNKVGSIYMIKHLIIFYDSLFVPGDT
jgi:hypothetical protein